MILFAVVICAWSATAKIIVRKEQQAGVDTMSRSLDAEDFVGYDTAAVPRILKGSKQKGSKVSEPH
jgi:hypothetical protein